MVALNVIRRVEVVGTSSGLDETKTKLDALSRAQTTVGTTAEGMATKTETSARRQLSAASAYDRLLRSIDETYRAEQRYASGQAVLDRAFQQGQIGVAAYSRGLEMVAEKFGVVSLAAARQTAALERAAAVQTRVNSMTGVSGGSDSAARATDVEAYGQALDRLQAKFDPMFAATQRYRSTLAEINDAQRVGAISSEVATAARLKETSAYNGQVAAMERVAQAQKAVAQSAVNQQTIVPNRGADIAAYGKQLDDLRAKYNPLFAAGRQYKDVLSEINAAARVGALSEGERASAVQKTKDAFTQQVASLRGASAATANMTAQSGLARHELINLSRQAQDVAVSLQGGQAFGTVMLQQGSQIVDIFMSMRGSLGGFFAQAAGWASTFATSMLGAFTAVGAVVVAGAAALISYRSAQEAIQISLMGIGRASSVTAQQLNDVGKAASGLTGLSTSEATEFATALAATGRVAQESLLPATQSGKNLAKVLGTDIATAAGIMGQALVGNLGPINARLGAFSFATQEQIKLLISQNREVEAQAIILDRVRTATAAASDITGGWSRAWTALGNAASNAWTAIGRGIDNALGMNKPIGEQYKDALSELDKLKAKRDELAKSAGPNRSGMSADQQDRVNFFLRLNPAADLINKTLAEMDDQIDKGTVAVNKMKSAMDSVKTASDQTRAAMQSIADAASSAALAPEIAVRRALANQTANAVSISRDPVRQSAIGITQAEADEQVKRAKGVETGYQTAAQKIAEGFEIANKAITAFSPKQRAEIAQLETAARLRDDPTMSPETKRAAAQEAYNVALKQGNVALSEAARARGLSAQQAVDSSKLEIDMVGKSIGQQTEMRANLQARQALEQQASQQRTGFDNAEYERLKLKNAELGKTAQLLALTQIRDQIKEDRQTVGFSQEDLQIAQALKQAYPDITERMNSAEAAQMRVNNALHAMADAQRDAFGDFLQNMRSGKSVMDSLTSALGGFADKLAKIGGDKLFDALKGGDISKAFSLNISGSTSQGITEGFEAIQAKAAAARANPNNSFSFNGGGGNAVAGGAMAAGAAIGIYGQARQQGAAGGSATSGALSGALSGAMAGSAILPGIGTAIGAVVGGIAGLFGASQGAREAAEQARSAWAASRGAALDFARVLSGGGNGSLSQAFSQANSQVQQFTETALKAGDESAVLAIQKAYYDFIIRSAKEFRDSFGGVIDALNSGLGPNSPFASAAQNVKSVGDSLKGFVDDTRRAFAADPVAETLNAQGGGGAKSAQDAAASANAAAEQIAQATAAAQKYLLSLLGQAPVLSEVATAVQHLQGTAAQLQSTLVDLGMSSDQAARAINAGVISAMAQLAATFTNGLQREINDALGQGYLNSTADLIARRTTALADAALLGTGTDLIDRWFSVQAQKLVDDAKLTGDAFNQLIAAFPQLQGAVHAFIDQAAIDTAAATAAQAAQQARLQQAQSQLSAAQSEYVSAQSALSSAYEAQKNMLEGLISAGKGFVDQFAKLKASLRLNDALSPLSAQDKYLEAQAQARATATLAARGDATAQARLADDLNAYLAQSKSYNASTLAYYNDFTEVQSILDQAGATAQQQVDVAQQQLAVLNQQVAGLISINSSVVSVAQAVANLQAAMANLGSAQGNLNNQRDWGLRPEINKMLVQGMESMGISYTGNFGPNSGFQEWVNSQVKSVQDAIYAIAGTIPTSLIDYYARQGLQNGGIVGAFANGGMIGNGIYGVDSVIARYAGGGHIALAGGEYVMPAAQTRANLPNLEAMRSGRGGAGNDNGAVVAELRALRTEVAALRQVTAAAGEHVGSRVDASAGVQKQSAAETRQATNRPAPYGTRKAG